MNLQHELTVISFDMKRKTFSPQASFSGYPLFHLHIFVCALFNGNISLSYYLYFLSPISIRFSLEFSSYWPFLLWTEPEWRLWLPIRAAG